MHCGEEQAALLSSISYLGPGERWVAKACHCWPVGEVSLQGVGNLVHVQIAPHIVQTANVSV